MKLLRREWRPLLAALLVVAATLASGAAALPSEEVETTGVPTDRPTEDVTQRLTLNLYEDRSSLAIAVSVIYPARTPAEARAAKEGTLDPEWFRADERIETVFSQVADDDERLTDDLLAVRHRETASRTPTDPPQGWVSVFYHIGWENFAAEGEDIVIGQEFVDVLGPDWLLEVTYPESWEPATLNGDPAPGVDGHQGLSETWDLSEEPETPLIVFERSGSESDDDSLALGPAGGIGPAALALLLVVIGATAHRIRHGG